MALAGRVRISPRPARTTGWSLTLLGSAVLLANWITEWTPARHLPEGHGLLCSMLATVVMPGGLGMVTKERA